MRGGEVIADNLSRSHVYEDMYCDYHSIANLHFSTILQGVLFSWRFVSVRRSPER